MRSRVPVVRLRGLSTSMTVRRVSVIGGAGRSRHGSLSPRTRNERPPDPDRAGCGGSRVGWWLLCVAYVVTDRTGGTGPQDAAECSGWCRDRAGCAVMRHRIYAGLVLLAAAYVTVLWLLIVEAYGRGLL